MKRFAFCVFLLGMLVVGCGSTPIIPTITMLITMIGYFVGTLLSMGSVPNTFTVSTAGAVEITLMMLMTASGAVVGFPIALSVGTFTGAVCSLMIIVNVIVVLKV